MFKAAVAQGRSARIKARSHRGESCPATYNLVEVRLNLVQVDAAVVVEKLAEGPDIWWELLLVY